MSGRQYHDLTTGRRLEGCAFGPCRESAERGGPGCHLCDVIAKLPQRSWRRAVDVDPADEKPQTNAARDGAPKLAGERERRHPMWVKRHRDGPHRGNA